MEKFLLPVHEMQYQDSPWGRVSYAFIPIPTIFMEELATFHMC